MIRAAHLRGFVVYARAATPWGLVAVSAATTAVLLLGFVAQRPATTWPLHGAAIGIVAGTSAWAADERCAAVVDVAPRPLWWRTAARATAVLILVVIWATLHVLARDDLPDHLGVLVLQGAGAALAGFAAATWQRVRAHAEPGQWIASFVAPLAAAVALARPLEEQVVLFPVWPHENWSRATTIWMCTGAGAVVALGAALRADARRSAGRGCRSGRPG